MVDNNGVLISP